MEEHTFEKLLPFIFLEEGVVDGGASEVVNHQLNYRLDLIFRIASVKGNDIVLNRIVRHRLV